ncbi:MAG: DMT family transporter [Clostridia bacterium]|nr:DMT family transporter [Clostridia bacterium]
MKTTSKKPLRGALILLTATVIWGLAYIAQSDAMQYLDVLTFNGVRILLGGIALIPIVPLYHRFDPAYRTHSADQKKQTFRVSVIGGVVCGVCMGTAATLQQYGIAMTSAGKSGFLTALYIVLVPIVGILFRRRVPWIGIVSVGIAVVGSYFLCVKNSFVIEKGDWLLILDAVAFAFQILFIDFFLERGGDSVTMACVEFLTAGLLLFPLMFLFEQPTWQNIWAARNTILYAGLVSGAVGYSMQMLGQKELEPTAASLLMSLESVFAALFGWWLLGERMTHRELIGCALVFIAVILSQLPIGRRRDT